MAANNGTIQIDSIADIGTPTNTSDGILTVDSKQPVGSQLSKVPFTGTVDEYLSGEGTFQAINRPPENDIGIPGGPGFMNGICPESIRTAAYTPLAGYDTRVSSTFGNYQYQDGSQVIWRPVFYYKIDANNIYSIKGEQSYATEAEANADGYVMPRAFIDGGTTKRGYFRDKYTNSKNAWGTGFVASSIKNGLPISTNSAHNPIADLTACVGNYNYEAINAAHARDGVDGAVNPNSIWFPVSQFILAAERILQIAHGQAAQGSTYCAWKDDTYNFPKGNNNNALGDTNDSTVSFTSDGYSNCAKAGSGVPFAKTTDNGQECGAVDVNGNMWKISLGLTCIATKAAIEGITSVAAPVFTWTAHGRSVGDYIQLDGITQADWLNFTAKIWVIDTVPTVDTYTLVGAPDATAYAAYDAATDAGTATAGDFYVAKEATAMKDFTSGNTLATDHWGAVGVAAMMDSFVPAFETAYNVNGYEQRFGSGANQVLSGDDSGLGYTLTGLGIPMDSGGVDTAGTNLYGTDYYYQYLRDQLCLLSGGGWASGGDAGVFASNWSLYRDASGPSISLCLACYLE